MSLVKFLLSRTAETEGWVEHPLFPPAVRDRLVAECEAKRRIVTIHGNGDAWCDHCSDWGDEASDQCPTLRLLAAVHASHPDYDPEWAV